MNAGNSLVLKRTFPVSCERLCAMRDRHNEGWEGCLSRLADAV